VKVQISKKHAFTLIELLVVISIIALLVAILMPALQKARRQTRTIVCKSNLHQYALGARMYLDDNDGSFPYPFTWLCKDFAFVGCGWHDASKNLVDNPDRAGELWPYLGAKDVHLCPEFNSVAKKMGCFNCDGQTIPIEPQYSYSMNAYLGGFGDTAWDHIPTQFQAAIKYSRKESQVKNPARVVFFSEENSWQVPELMNAPINDNNFRSTPDIGEDHFGTFHNAPSGDLNNSFANAVFVDGHVEEVSAYPAGNTFALSWPGGTPIPDW